MAHVIYGISCLCHPNRGVRYVGQTSRSLARRRAEHKHHATKARYRMPVYDWIRKHGWDNMIFRVLDQAPDQNSADAKEIYWIATLGTGIQFGGMNYAPGGACKSRTHGTRRGSHTYESRAKMSRSTQKMLSDEQVREIRALKMAGHKQVDIARRFGVSESIISLIVRNKLYNYVVAE